MVEREVVQQLGDHIIVDVLKHQAGKFDARLILWVYEPGADLL